MFYVLLENDPLVCQLKEFPELLLFLEFDRPLKRSGLRQTVVVVVVGITDT